MIYYQDEWVTQYCSDALTVLSGLENDTVDLLCTDPPYGLSSIVKRFGKDGSAPAKYGKDGAYARLSSGFMGKKWDVLPDMEIWRECLRVLKPGAFAFVMCTPRQDSLAPMILRLQDAGFEIGFTPIYWAYASGFPKAKNIGKAVDKRLGVEREVVGQKVRGDVEKAKQSGSTFAVADANKNNKDIFGYGVEDITIPSTPQAKALDGSYGGFQPKPAVEVIIVCMKPLSEKTFVDQALKNRKGITWLDDCRVPGAKPECKNIPRKSWREMEGRTDIPESTPQIYNTSEGRFPANLLVSDDVLNDGKVTKSTGGKSGHTGAYSGGYKEEYYGNMKPGLGDSGSFSRYFDLDKWAQTLPFLIVPKASKSEKSRGLDMRRSIGGGMQGTADKSLKTGSGNERENLMKNTHPTVKPLKLMSYLITLGSREGDTILDPFGGSGTTPLACQLLNRKCIAIELEEKYCKIAANRCSQGVFDLR